MNTDIIADAHEPVQSGEPSFSRQASDLRAALAREINPSTVAEQLLVNEVARRANQAAELDVIATDLGSGIKSAIHRFANEADGTNIQHLADLTAVERLNGIIAQSQRCSRGISEAIKRLREISKDRRDLAATGGQDDRFLTDEQCYAYLLRRYRTGEQACLRCGCRGSGWWIPSHRAWECASCKTQTGIRCGSVMERSPLPLTLWFRAIRLLGHRPNMKPRELAENLGIKRLATVRSIRKKIREALASQPSALVGIADINLPDLSALYS